MERFQLERLLHELNEAVVSLFSEHPLIRLVAARLQVDLLAGLCDCCSSLKYPLFLIITDMAGISLKKTARVVST